jgi:hypothetical protein
MKFDFKFNDAYRDFIFLSQGKVMSLMMEGFKNWCGLSSMQGAIMAFTSQLFNRYFVR